MYQIKKMAALMCFPGRSDALLKIESEALQTDLDSLTIT